MNNVTIPNLAVASAFANPSSPKGYAGTGAMAGRDASGPVTIILFGITGDLSRRKIIPALYQMVTQHGWKSWSLIGVAREQKTIESILNEVRSFIPSIKEDAWNNFISHSSYFPLDARSSQSYQELAQHIDQQEAKHNSGNMGESASGLSRRNSKSEGGSLGKNNRLVYLAVGSDLFCSITAALAQYGIVKRVASNEPYWHRIIYEKPFGDSQQSAHAINQCISEHFYETQIYRIDHFLSKELVANIALVRFTNAIFEPLWNNKYIEHVQIVLNEELDVEERSLFYDRYGALSDVVQNHMLEMLALIAMEAPEQLSGDFVRNERLKVLSKVSFVDGIRGQYRGYLQHEGVAQNSTTETFAALTLAVNNPRWQGVPFFLKTGKALREKNTSIHIKFKHVNCLLSSSCPSESNYLTINITPDAGFVLQLNAKKVGASYEVTPVEMKFCHSCLYGPFTTEDYQTLLSEIIKGDLSIAVRFDEIEQCWRVIDTIKQQNIPISIYEKKSAGPDELEEFEKRHTMRWRS